MKGKRSWFDFLFFRGKDDDNSQITATEIVKKQRKLEELNKTANDIKDLAIDVGLGLLPGGVPVQVGLAVSGLAEKAKEATNFQMPDAGPHYIGPLPPDASPEKRAKLSDAIRNPSVPQTVTLNLSQFPMTVKEEENLTTDEMKAKLKQNLQSMGLNNEEAKQAVESLKGKAANLQHTYHQTKLVLNASIKNAQQASIDLETMKNIDTCLDSFERLGAAIKCKGLQQFCAGAKAVFTIGYAINLLFKPGGSVIAPSNLLISGASALFSLLVGGQDLPDIIIEQLNGISNQIATFEKSTFEAFGTLNKNLQINLHAVIEGFNHLSEQLHNLGSHLIADQVNLQHSMHHMHEKMNFLARHMDINARKKVTIKLERDCTSAYKYVALNIFDDKDKIEAIWKLKGSLENFILGDSHDENLTGITFWQACAGNFTSIFNEFIKHFTPEMISIHYVGLLAHYALNKSPQLEIDPRSLSNLCYLYKALDKYLILSQTFPECENDPENKFLKEAISILHTNLAFIEKIKDDEILWATLISGYYNSLSRIKNSINTYAAEYSIAQKKLYDQKYRCARLSEGDFNYLETPDSFKEKFNSDDRTINEVRLTTQKNVAIVDKHYRKDLNELTKNSRGSFSQEPFKTPLRERHTLGRRYLCAEYLGLIEFTAEQDGPIQGLEWGNVIPVLPEFKFETVAFGPPRIKPFPPTCDASISSEILVHPQWQLPIIIFYTDKNAHKHRVSRLIFSRDWKGLTPATFRVFQHKEEAIQINGKTYGVYHASGENEEKKYGNHLINFISICWENNDLTCSLRENLASEQSQNEINTLLTEHYFEHRQNLIREICDRLLEKDRPIAGHQATINHLKDQLDELDKHVQLLRQFAYHIGKNIEHPPLSNLVDANKIKHELAAYLNENMPNLALPFVPSLDQALEQRNVTQETIRVLPDARPLHITFLSISLLRLQLFECSKSLPLPSHPNTNREIQASVNIASSAAYFKSNISPAKRKQFKPRTAEPKMEDRFKLRREPKEDDRFKKLRREPKVDERFKPRTAESQAEEKKNETNDSSCHLM